MEYKVKHIVLVAKEHPLNKEETQIICGGCFDNIDAAEARLIDFEPYTQANIIHVFDNKIHQVNAFRFQMK